MKKILTLILSLVLFQGLLSAQRFKPLESWPLLYEEFEDGTTFSRSGEVISHALLNISVVDGSLMYLAGDGTIMNADKRTLSTARVGKDVYLNGGGWMMKVLAETEHGAVVLKSEVDVDEMGKANIGYGKSSVASTQNVSLIAVIGGDMAHKSLEDMKEARYSGKELPVKERIYLVVDGILVRATKNDVLSWPGADKDAVKAYLKANKVKWRDPASLSALTEFLYEQKK